MTDEPDSLVLTLLRRLDTKVDKMSIDLATHGRVFNVVQQDIRLIRAAVNDIARTDVTSGEIEASHHDLNRLQQEVSELAARLEIIEGRDRH